MGKYGPYTESSKKTDRRCHDFAELVTRGGTASEKGVHMIYFRVKKDKYPEVYAMLEEMADNRVNIVPSIESDVIAALKDVYRQYKEKMEPKGGI